MEKYVFYKRLEWDVFCFSDAPSIVMTSFFSQKSISHLDLQISQCALAEMWKFPHMSTFRTKKSFFCSNESLRNNLVKKRRLLYTLHLDLPRGREDSDFKKRPSRHTANRESFFIVFRHKKSFLRNVLLDLLEPAFEKTDSKLKFLNWILDFRPLEKVSFFPFQLQLLCVESMHRELADSEIATKFLRRKIIRIYMFQTAEETDSLEFLLRSARVCDCDMRLVIPCNTSLIDDFMPASHFPCFQSFLKYDGMAYYTEESYSVYRRILGGYGGRNHQLLLAERMNKLRLQRILQMIYIFVRQKHLEYHVRPYILEALRLIWSSIPDSFVSLEEMYYAYEGLLDSNLIREAHSFYEEAIRQTVSSPQPRPLTQYCRCLIRKCLNQRKQWLPDRIKQLQLPPRFKSFLNLERDDLQPGVNLEPMATS